MKLTLIIIISLLLVCISLSGHAQVKEKRYLSARGAFPTLPTHFPLAMEGFKRLSSKFGMRKHPILKKNRFHPGLDLAAKHGTPVYTSAHGKVVLATYSKIYGNYIIIEHKSGYKTLYGHLSSSVVKKHQTVKQGTLIGYVGSTGRSTGPHLHYEISKNNKRIDPLAYWIKTIKEIFTIVNHKTNIKNS